MEYSFPRYLLAKQTVDDRALNKDVLAALKAELSAFDIRFSVLRQPSVPESASALRFSDSSAVDSASSVVDPVFSVTEVGAGIGTMLTRLLRWDILPPNVDYALVDEMPENITFARQWLPQWARENGYQVETLPDETIRFSDSRQPSVPKSVLVHFIQADVFDYIRFSASQSAAPSADLLIAHAFLDLLPMPESLPKLFSLLKPGGLAWLTINFDGVTTFEPPFRLSDLPRASQRGSPADDLRFSVSRQPSAPESVSGLRLSDLPRASQRGSSAVDSASSVDDIHRPASPSSAPSVSPFRRRPSAPESVDSIMERLYHQTMDTRPTGGDSRSGRHLFKHLEQTGAGILAAGASDWVVYPVKGQYPADEAYFLHFILRFFETSLANNPELDPRLLEEWLKQRRAQIERAELVYIAHQMDFLISTR